MGSQNQNQNQSQSQNIPEASNNDNNNSENLYDFLFASTGREIEYFDDVSFKGINKIPKSCPYSSRSPNPKRREIKSQPLKSSKHITLQNNPLNKLSREYKDKTKC